MDVIYAVLVELDQKFLKKSKKSKTQLAKDLFTNFGESFVASYSANVLGYPLRSFTEPYGLVVDDALLTGLAHHLSKHYITGGKPDNIETLKRIVYKVVARELWKLVLNNYGSTIQAAALRMKQKTD